MTQMFQIPVQAMGKPRMTQADKWRKRDCVVRFRAYADVVRYHCKGVMPHPVNVSWTAWFAFPPSYSKAKRALLADKPHQQKPDRDNIDKGILDALWENDQGVATGRLDKRWDDGAGARITLIVSDDNVHAG